MQKPENLRWYDDGVFDGLQMAADIFMRNTDIDTARRKFADLVAYIKMETQKTKS